MDFKGIFRSLVSAILLMSSFANAAPTPLNNMTRNLLFISDGSHVHQYVFSCRLTQNKPIHSIWVLTGEGADFSEYKSSSKCASSTMLLDDPEADPIEVKPFIEEIHDQTCSTACDGKNRPDGVFDWYGVHYHCMHNEE